MAQLNDYNVTRRFNRPGTLDDTLLELNWIKNGIGGFPDRILSVHLVKDESYGDPSVHLDEDGEVIEDDRILMRWSNEFEDLLPESSYEGTVGDFSSIYMTGPSRMGVVNRLGSRYLTADGTVENNAAETVGKYFDLWTVVDQDGNPPVVFAHSVELFADNIITTTEPLNIVTSNNLVQKYVKYGEKIKLTRHTEHAITNRNISSDITNMFKDSIISDAALKITKITGGGEKIEVLKFEDSEPDVYVNSSDTITYLWDTSIVNEFQSEEGWDGPRGIYEVQGSYGLLDEARLTDKFKLIVR